jgi:dynein intermediate chain 1
MPPKKVKAPGAAPEPQAAAPTHDEPRHTIIPGNDWEPPKMMIRPTDQISLTEKELGEELTRLWKAENPNAAHNIAHFSHKEKIFKHVATVEQSEFHLMQVPIAAV